MSGSRWQQEYEALPEWARELVDALKPNVGYGVGGVVDSLGPPTILYFKTSRQAGDFMSAIAGAREFTDALSAPWPPPVAPKRERRAINVVEFAAEGDDCAFDQPCCFGHRVESHAVYCHNEAWPDSPRKCRRNRTDYLHEDCPGFVANPDAKTDIPPASDIDPIIPQPKPVRKDDDPGPPRAKSEIRFANWKRRLGTFLGTKQSNAGESRGTK